MPDAVAEVAGIERGGQSGTCKGHLEGDWAVLRGLQVLFYVGEPYNLYDTVVL